MGVQRRDICLSEKWQRCSRDVAQIWQRYTREVAEIYQRSGTTNEEHFLLIHMR